MTRDDIIRMAMESGITRVMDESSYRWMLEGREPINEVFIKFAALVAAAEREECAKLVDEHKNPINDPLAPIGTYESGKYVIAEFLADAIRARGQE